MNASTPARWTERRTLPLHLAILVWVPGCAVACWWQVTVALGGDHLGWLYSIEWPAFGIFGIVVWWNLIHDDPQSVGHRGTLRARRAPVTVTASDRARPETARAVDEDADLAAYNDYLAALQRTGSPKRWRRANPGSDEEQPS